MKLRGVVILIISIFLMNFASASFSLGNLSHSIETQYSPSEKISGWMNISLNDEPSDYLISDSGGDSIMLLELLKQNENLVYFCNTQGCVNDYAVDGNSKSFLNFILDSKQRKLIGIKLKGNIKSITSLSLILDSNAEASCYSQTKVDILNDGSIDFINRKIYLWGDSCDSLLSKGCFNNSKNSEEYSIGKFENKHCQKIILSSSPGFKIGAWINNQTSDMRKITMALYNLNMEEVEGAQCNLPTIVGVGNASCKINYSIKEPTPYFVCIYSADKTGTTKVRGYGDEINGCGFYQESGERYPEQNAAFDIFAQGLGFDTVGEMSISDSSEETMSNIKNYIYDMHGSYDCGVDGCIIPILIDSEKLQNITLKNLKLEYVTNMGPTETKDLYFIKESPPKITSGFQKIFLDYGNFTAPSQYGEKLFKIKINGKDIFSETIDIKNFPKIVGISPTIVPALIPTTFTVSSVPSKNITGYIWDFNDSTPIEKTLTNKTNHTYRFSGNYKVKILVQNTEGLNTSKTFDILATIPKSQIQSELEKKLETLETIKKQMANLDSVVQEGLDSVLGIRELESDLKSLQREYNFASTEEDYANIAGNLSMMRIPELITITKKAPLLPFYPLRDLVDLDVLKEVGGGDYKIEQREDYQNAVLGWQMDNVDIKVSMEEFSTIIKGESIPVLTKFIVNVEKNYSEKPVYLFIKKMKDLNFKERYFEKESGNYFYWVLEENNNEIEFSTSEIINYEELPAFVSPEISSLLIESKDIPSAIKNLKMRWTVISVSLLILLFGAMIIYSLLSVWYKRKYESYLFKNRNDLYNLISYVNISKKKGEKEEIMRTNLKKAGWTGEQITYVLKKYSGKRTGMVELPLTKLIDRLLGKYEKPNPQNPRMNPVGRINPAGRPF